MARRWFSSPSSSVPVYYTLRPNRFLADKTMRSVGFSGSSCQADRSLRHPQNGPFVAPAVTRSSAYTRNKGFPDGQLSILLARRYEVR
jgi:hypothetical protein